MGVVSTSSSALLLALLSSVLAIAVGYVFLPHWIPQYGAVTIFWARVFVISAPMQSLALVGRAALESRDSFFASNNDAVAATARA